MISDAAVEAAAWAIREYHAVLIPAPEGEHGASLAYRTPEELAPYILEAAAPHMLGVAREQGWEAGPCDANPYTETDNPYRSQA